MRAPAPSFQSELAACREWLTPPENTADRWAYELSMEILDRWQRAPVETIWSTIKPKLLVADAAAEAAFIFLVLETRIEAEQLDEVALGLPAAEFKAIPSHTKFIKKGDLDRAGEILKTLDAVKKGRKRLLSRKKKTAARTRFMAYWSNYFERMCGWPLFDTVASLTNIVFDLKPKPGINRKLRARGGPYEVTAEDVRKAYTSTVNRLSASS